MAKKVVLYFAHESPRPLPREVDKLKELEGALEYPDTKVKLAGHASTEGTDRFNLKLSKERADFVVAYLVAMGASPRAIQTKAFGERKPAVKEKGGGSALEKQRAKNRRVEVEYELGKPPRDKRFQKYVDTYRQRLKKAVANLKKRVEHAQAGRKRTMAHPDRSPYVLAHWQDEVDAATDELREYARELKKLKALESKHSTAEEVWWAIADTPDYFDRIIGYQREHIANSKRRLDEAKQRLGRETDEKNVRFWKELVAHYTGALKRQIGELRWLLEDKKRAAQSRRR